MEPGEGLGIVVFYDFRELGYSRGSVILGVWCFHGRPFSVFRTCLAVNPHPSRFLTVHLPSFVDVLEQI